MDKPKKQLIPWLLLLLIAGLGLATIEYLSPVVCSNMAALRALTPNASKPAIVLGYYTPGDGGGGMTRDAVATNEIALTTGGYAWKDVGAGYKTIETLQLHTSATKLLKIMGGPSGSATPLEFRQTPEFAIGTDIVGANAIYDSGLGTGAAAPSSVYIRTPIATASGTGIQSLVNAFQINAPTTTDDSFAILTFWNGATYVTGRVARGAPGTGPGGVGRALYVP